MIKLMYLKICLHCLLPCLEIFIGKKRIQYENITNQHTQNERSNLFDLKTTLNILSIK